MRILKVRSIVGLKYSCVSRVWGCEPAAHSNADDFSHGKLFGLQHRKNTAGGAHCFKTEAISTIRCVNALHIPEAWFRTHTVPSNPSCHVCTGQSRGEKSHRNPQSLFCLWNPVSVVHHIEVCEVHFEYWERLISSFNKYLIITRNETLQFFPRHCKPCALVLDNYNCVWWEYYDLNICLRHRWLL